MVIFIHLSLDSTYIVASEGFLWECETLDMAVQYLEPFSEEQDKTKKGKDEHPSKSICLL